MNPVQQHALPCNLWSEIQIRKNLKLNNFSLSNNKKIKKKKKKNLIKKKTLVCLILSHKMHRCYQLVLVSAQLDLARKEKSCDREVMKSAIKVQITNRILIFIISPKSIVQLLCYMFIPFSHFLSKIETKQPQLCKTYW